MTVAPCMGGSGDTMPDCATSLTAHQQLSRAPSSYATSPSALEHLPDPSTLWHLRREGGGALSVCGLATAAAMQWFTESRLNDDHGFLGDLKDCLVNGAECLAVKVGDDIVGGMVYKAYDATLAQGGQEDACGCIVAVLALAVDETFEGRGKCLLRSLDNPGASHSCPSRWRPHSMDASQAWVKD